MNLEALAKALMPGGVIDPGPIAPMKMLGGAGLPGALPPGLEQVFGKQGQNTQKLLPWGK